jgi:hypothetical protein
MFLVWRKYKKKNTFLIGQICGYIMGNKYVGGN